MSLLEQIAENISDYDLPSLPAIAVIELEDDICAIVHDSSNCKFFTVQGDESSCLCVSFAYDDTTSHAEDVLYHYALVSEVGEGWIVPCEEFAEKLSLTPVLLEGDPGAIMRVDEPQKFWGAIRELSFSCRCIKSFLLQ
jgi:hypothetical protein